MSAQLSEAGHNGSNDMNEAPRRDEPAGAHDGNTIAPLPGEPGIPDVSRATSTPMSRKGLLAVALLVVSLLTAAGVAIHRFATSGKSAGDAESKRVSDRPTAATTEPRRLDMPPGRAASVVAASAPRIPALVPAAEEMAEPIGVRRTGQALPSGSGAKLVSPVDAPVVLVSTRPGAGNPAGASGIHRQEATAEQAANGPAEGAGDPLDQTRQNLEGYQRQLQGLLDTLTRSTTAAVGSASAGSPLGGATLGLPSIGGPPTVAGTAPSNSLFGGQLQGSATPRATASLLGNRSLTLPKGSAFTCALKTKVISAASGLVGCLVQRNVFSDDGRVLLIERGSHMDGEYRITSVRPGTVRIPVLWTRIRTPQGVTVDIESPGTGQLGESGIDGHVDNRWGERIGAAMLLSLIDDSAKLVIQSHANDTQANTVLLPSTTANTSKLAEKVLDSTINIPPLIYQNQGGIVGIYVARDVDFSSVYELKPVSR